MDVRVTRVLRAVTVFVLAVPIAPLPAGAQPAGKVWRVGYLSRSTVDFDKSWVAAFKQGLRELGYVEGQNVVVEQRQAAGRAERLPELATDLTGERLELLKAVVPRASRIAIPWDPAAAAATGEFREALIVAAFGGLFDSHQARIIDLAVKTRLLAIFSRIMRWLVAS